MGQAISNKAPDNWITRLGKLRVCNFRSDLSNEMALAWNRRHELVHSPQPPPGNAAIATGRYAESRKQFERAIDVAFSFVQSVDAYVLETVDARCNEL